MSLMTKNCFWVVFRGLCPSSEKNIFLADFAMESRLNAANSVIVASFNNWCIEFRDGNQIDETLMSKGFQRIAKKIKKENVERPGCFCQCGLKNKP